MIEKYIKEKLQELMEHSNCEKRHVACLITDANEHIISVGVNYHKDGVCDCCSTKTAEHAEMVALDALPNRYDMPLTAYISHKPCQNCRGQLETVCEEVIVHEMSERLKTCPETDTIDDILEEREHTHGDFKESSRFVQATKAAMQSTPNWLELGSDQQEALHMIQHKIGRALYGNHNFYDTWCDISGYAKLVCERLKNESSD